ncbi:MarR family transcriptional regulator [[Mycobacterium] vasticus]|uniref:MarR family transcriptional regulator n=1 Tax=[Mycobacterium] vasticus TaxID=2875777 RepID=A0ABU5Z242_9MYCO|nr:MarR family transcriptional regulator [Mycolicibacter sp. MYC017]MEB3071471.1 MarR family transcriptional regulator [Mycolicibacter sp. MYC017]
MSELKTLQAIRLKGRVSPADLAATVGEDAATIAATIEGLSEAGLVIAGATVRISPEGRERLAALLLEERSKVDPAAIAAVYEKFRGVNADFKALVTDWQLKDGEPNAHDDADYDAAVLARLDAIHAQVLPIVAAAAIEVPRLTAYADKLSSAATKLKGGETLWFTRPIIDSYHTVWFELHEELILAAGLTREAEAKAGHAE